VSDNRDDQMATKTPKHMAAEAALSEELRAEFNAFLTDYKKGCEETGIRYIPKPAEPEPNRLMRSGHANPSAMRANLDDPPIHDPSWMAKERIAPLKSTS
jgi:hypothetical protein